MVSPPQSIACIPLHPNYPFYFAKLNSGSGLKNGAKPNARQATMIAHHFGLKLC